VCHQIRRIESPPPRKSPLVRVDHTTTARDIRP
jgi:hypothetical protein